MAGSLFRGVVLRRLVAVLVACTVVAVGLVGLIPEAAAAAITTTKTASASVRAGAPITMSVTVRNPVGATAAPEYNVSIRDQLLAGVTYVAGSTVPSTFGEPRIVVSGGRQVLLWENISDLPVGAGITLTFQVTPAPATYPVGSTVTNQAQSYANTDPRIAPTFGATGTITTGTATQSATSNTTSTVISAIDVTKSQPQPEAEVLRGVHRPTVYTLTVSDTTVAATTGVTVVDYIPAGMEFLGCGTVDNSAALEYPTAPGLDAVADLTTDCLTPVAVDTVTNPPGQPAGVYTQVTWSLGTLAAGAVQRIQYYAGIPMRANTATFPAGTPSAASLLQTANLDNNTGALTREGSTELAITNAVTVSGSYTGPVATGTSTAVTASTTATVTAEDLALLKSVSPTRFDAGGIATFTLTVRAGEYASGSAITITDVLPDGLCPLSDTINYAPGAPAECAAVAGSNPIGAAYQSVTANANGTFTIVFTPVAVPADGQLSVVFRARMRAAYGGAGVPTVSGDGYQNTASLTGTTTPTSASGDPGGTVTVTDQTQVGLTSDSPTLTKKVQPDDPAVRPYTCSSSSAAYVDNLAPTDPTLTFDEGDRVCFLIRIQFSTTNTTRSPVLTDFLPPGMVYEAGSAVVTAGSAPAVLTTIPAAPVPPAGATGLTWTIGTLSGGVRYAAADSFFEVRFAALVSAPPAGSPVNTANLAKLNWTNTAGGVSSLRDAVDVSLAPPPPMTIAKGASRITPAPVTVLANNAIVPGGAVVEYTVTATNGGTLANRNALDILGPEIWDVLPAGITCAMISAISDGGVCFDYDPASTTNPVPRAALLGRSLIRWDLPNTTVLAPGAAKAVTYRLTVPLTPSVSLVYTNTAAVSTFQTTTDYGTLADHAPATNINAAVTATDVPAAQTTRSIRVANASTNKSATTEIVESGNTAAQATIGELITYRYSVTVPANSSVLSGVLSDAFPAGVVLVSTPAPTATYTLSPAGAPQPLPAGFTLDAATGTLTFPATYANDTNTVQTFTVTATVRVTTDPTNLHGAVLNNRASFASVLPDGTAIPARVSSIVPITVVEPSPTITKVNNDPDGIVAIGDILRYTVTVTNAAGRPPLHDAYVVDCLPNPLLVTGTATPAVVSIVPGDGSNGCPLATDRLEFRVGDLAGGATFTISYDATAPEYAGGLQRFTNVATLTGSSMDDNKPAQSDPDRSTERVYAVAAQSSIVITPALTRKTVDKPTANVGERVTYTLTAVIPAGANYYDAAILDTAPAGLTDFALVGFDCLFADGTSCLSTVPPDGGQAMTPVVNPDGTTSLGFTLGDFVQRGNPREFTVSYSALVTDVPGNVVGTRLTNTAKVVWDDRDLGVTPTDPKATWLQSAVPVQSTVTVTEPSLSIDKSVSTSTPEPGQTLTYQLAVTNATGATTGPAVTIVVRDVVPAGVVVDAATITGGGTLTGADPSTGGGTIEWAVPGPLAAGATTTLSYAARLATPAPTATLTNTASIPSYRSVAEAVGRSYTGPSDTAQVTARLPHVSLAKDVIGSTQAAIGQPIRWQLVLTNDGAGAAYGIDAVDTLPPNWTFDADSAVVTVNGDALSPAAAQPVVTGSSPQTLTWTDLGTLPPGTTAVISFTATPQPDVVTSPGIGTGIQHVNSATPGAEDATGASAAADGTAYAGGPDTAAVTIAAADLAIAKSASGAAVAGADLSWTIRVSNAGPDPAAGPWTVTDTLPAALTGTAVGTDWSCTSGHVIVCTHPGATSLPVGQSLPDLVVTTTLPAGQADGSTLTNRASVTGVTDDPQPANNTTDSTVTVATRADLVLDKQDTPDFVAGTIATWRLVVTNDGPSVATGPVVVHDTLPIGAVFGSAVGTDWSCVAAGPEVTCTRTADLPVGPAPELLLRATLDPAQTADIVNTATVSSATTDPTPANNTDSVTSPVATSADLDLQKVSITPLLAGTRATYEFTVHNAGPSVATGVVVTDQLPTTLTYAGFALVSPTSGWTCSVTARLVSCALAGALAPQADAVVRVDVDVASTVTGAVVNRATVGADTPDPLTANNTDEDDSGVRTESDLGLTKTHPNAPVVAGTTVRYTLQASNQGPSASPGPVVVTDVFPAGITPTAAQGTGWVCEITGQQVRCERAGSFDVAQAVAPITVDADVAPDAGPATLDNIAAIDGPGTDPVPGNDAAVDPTRITDSVDLRITKTAGSAQVLAGTSSTYSVVVHNDGPSEADGIVVTDTAPAGLTITAAAGTGWDCAVLTPTSLRCTRPGLAAGSTAAAITVTTTVAPGVTDGTVLTNAAAVTTTSPEPDPEDNTASADVLVRTAADLTITKTHSATAVAGNLLDFHVAVTNAGPSDAAAPVTVTDVLPAGMTFRAAAGGDWVCTPEATDPQRISCRSDSAIGVTGAAAPLTLTVALAPEAAGTVTNQAGVTSATVDPAVGNNATTDSVTVTEVADLSIAKSHTGVPIVGGQVSYTLTAANAGPSVARGVTLTDPLPAGLEPVLAEGDGWACSITGASVTCARAEPAAPGVPLPPVTVTARVGAAAYPSVTNTATVASTATDPDPANDAASDPATVPALANLVLTKTHLQPLVVGESATYRLTVHNDGPTEALGPIVITDTLPTGLAHVAATGAGVSCAVDGQTVTCTAAGPLAVGADLVVDLQVQVGPAAYPQVRNTGSVTTPSAQTSVEDDAATDAAPVQPTVVLGLTKTLRSVDGTSASYDIVVRNAGPSDTVEPIVVVDELPTELALAAAGGPGWVCPIGAGALTCSYAASLPAGAEAGFTVTATLRDGVPRTGQSITNRASLDAGAPNCPTSLGCAASADLVLAPPPPPPPPSPSPVPAGGPLAQTGANVQGGLVWALLLLLAGAGAIVVARRRA